MRYTWVVLYTNPTQIGDTNCIRTQVWPLKLNCRVLYLFIWQPWSPSWCLAALEHFNNRLGIYKCMSENHQDKKCIWLIKALIYQDSIRKLLAGKLVEEEEGSLAVWMSYLVTGVGANLVSWLILPRSVVSVGASGAVFGLFAISVLVKVCIYICETKCITCNLLFVGNIWLL